MSGPSVEHTLYLAQQCSTSPLWHPFSAAATNSFLAPTQRHGAEGQVLVEMNGGFRALQLKEVNVSLQFRRLLSREPQAWRTPFSAVTVVGRSADANTTHIVADAIFPRAFFGCPLQQYEGKRVGRLD